MKLSKRKGWIGLKGLSIQGSIGVYDNEKQNGNTLIANVWVYGNLAPAIISDEIEDCLNYEDLAKIAGEEIQGGSHLLEPVAHSILIKILGKMPLAEKAKIELSKLNPPLDNPCDASVVKLSLKRKHLKK